MGAGLGTRSLFPLTVGVKCKKKKGSVGRSVVGGEAKHGKGRTVWTGWGGGRVKKIVEMESAHVSIVVQQ